jgi:hypothetical protein
MYNHLTEKEVDFFTKYKETFRIGLIPFYNIEVENNLLNLLYYNKKDLFIGKRIPNGSYYLFENPIKYTTDIFKKYAVVLLKKESDKFYDDDVEFCSTLFLKNRKNLDSPVFDGSPVERISDFLMEVIVKMLNGLLCHTFQSNPENCEYLYYHDCFFDKEYMFKRLFETVGRVNLQNNKQPVE